MASLMHVWILDERQNEFLNAFYTSFDVLHNTSIKSYFKPTMQVMTHWMLYATVQYFLKLVRWVMVETSTITFKMGYGKDFYHYNLYWKSAQLN